MNAYSEDLRKKIGRALRRGMGKSEAARAFGASLSSVRRYSETADEGARSEEEARLPTKLL